jgi:hypothetical protein
MGWNMPLEAPPFCMTHTNCSLHGQPGSLASESCLPSMLDVFCVPLVNAAL